MNSEVIIHPTTKQRFKNFLAQPSHALIINAPAGSGKITLAKWLITQIAKQPLDKLTYLRIISPVGQSISINEIRSLNQYFKLKTIGQAPLRRFMIIEQAEALTLEAQNAFLKLFEEPPEDSLTILTVNNPKSLLPTILSRAQVINVRLPSKQQLQPYAAKVKNFERLYNLSAGRPGLLFSMINGEFEHPLIEAVEAAKQLLIASKFEQLIKVDELARQKDSVSILDALQLIADRSLASAASQHNLTSLKRWQKILAATYSTKLAFQQGAQAKLAWTNLVLNL